MNKFVEMAAVTGLVGSVAFGFIGCGGGGGGDSTPTTATQTESYPFDGAEPLTQAQINQYLAEINSARAVETDCHTEGVFPPAPPLQWSDGLYKAAAEHSTDMASTGVLTLDHSGSGTETDWTSEVLNLGRASSWTERIKNNYPAGGTEIAGGGVGYDSYPYSAYFPLWKASDKHCVILMNPSLKYAGVSQVGGFVTITFSGN